MYFIGGSADGKNVTNTVLSYDPVNEDWKAHAGMPTARYAGMAAVVNDKIYVIGGNDGSNYLSVVEEYDPATDNWVKNYSDIPTGRMGSAVGAIGGRIYVAGGAAPDSGVIPVKVLDDVQVFDPAAKSWSPGPKMSSKRAAMPSLAHNGKLYVFGGVEICGIIPDACYLKTVEALDPAAGWSRLPDLGEERAAAMIGVIKDHAYVIGGCRNKQDCDDVRSDNEQISLANPTGWTRKAPMPTPRAAAGVASIGGLIIIIGGGQGKISDPVVMRANELYDPEGIMAVQVQASSGSVYSGETLDISARVLGSGIPQDSAAIAFSSDKGGSFNPANGSTNSTGSIAAQFTAPLVSNDEMVTVTVQASKAPYAPANGSVVVTVKPPTLGARLQAEPNTVFAKKTATVSATISQGAKSVEDADVAFSASCGTLDQAIAKTGPDGIAKVTFTAPDVQSDTTCKVDSKATKAGYKEGSASETITVIASSPEFGLAAGVVTHGKTKQPIAGAKVVASGPASKEVLTDAEGKYRLRDLPPGSYEIKVSMQDFQANSSKVEVRAGETAAADFELWPSEGGVVPVEDKDWWASLPWWMKLFLLYILPIILAIVLVALLVRRRRKRRMKRQQEAQRDSLQQGRWSAAQAGWQNYQDQGGGQQAGYGQQDRPWPQHGWDQGQGAHGQEQQWPAPYQQQPQQPQQEWGGQGWPEQTGQSQQWGRQPRPGERQW